MLQYRPPRIALTLVLAAAALQFVTRSLWPAVPASVYAGVMLSVLGFCIMLRAWWLFRSAQTAICPTAATTSLVTDDIYRVTRNPMYLGIVLMLLGLAVSTGGVFFYAAAVCFFAIVNHVFCRYEELQLQQQFGASFSRYARRVRRWL
jgi:protein-S-isoprenylcysteine O-methyltransferase Ste14